MKDSNILFLTIKKEWFDNILSVPPVMTAKIANQIAKQWFKV